jgi:hypothetical protein
VRQLTTLAVALGVTLWLPMAGYAADEAGPSAEPQEAPAKCLEALVNPVTGYTLCVKPRGAPVEQASPSKEPCKPRDHDNETGTVYEHWSAC